MSFSRVLWGWQKGDKNFRQSYKSMIIFCSLCRQFICLAGFHLMSVNLSWTLTSSVHLKKNTNKTVILSLHVKYCRRSLDPCFPSTGPVGRVSARLPTNIPHCQTLSYFCHHHCNSLKKGARAWGVETSEPWPDWLVEISSAPCGNKAERRRAPKMVTVRRILKNWISYFFFFFFFF